jgi:hypothetical protein
MKTTLNLDDALMRSVKERAARTGTTLTALVESALRELLAGQAKSKKPFRFKLTPVKGKLRPGVDLADRDSLFDIMDGLR